MSIGNTPPGAAQGPLTGIFILGTTGTADVACPDCNAAVNNTYIVEFINGTFAVYNKATAESGGRASDTEFWQKAGLSADAPLVDPRIVFIPEAGVSGQWLAVQLLNMGQEVYIATTDPTDPLADPRLGKWKGAQFPLAGADFPMLGYDADGIYIGSNTAAGGPDRQPQLVCIPRAKALAWPPEVDSAWISIPLPIADYGTNLFPVINPGAWPLSRGIAIGVDTKTKKHLTYACMNSGGIQVHGRIEVEPFEPVPRGFGVKQPSSTNPGSASGVRFYSNGSVSAPIGDGSSIWMTHTVAKPGGPLGTLAVRWYRLSVDGTTGLPSLAAWGEVSQPHYDYFNSSILSFGKDDYTVLSMSRSGDSTTPTNYRDAACGNIGAYVALVREKPGGQFQFQLSPMASGMADNFTPGPYTQRWGDYSTIFKDTNRPRGVWTINQYVTQGGDASQWRDVMAGFIVPPV